MPMDVSRYPATWREISQRIRERAGWRCEWCGAPNHELIVRDHATDPKHWRIAEYGDLENADNDAPKVTRVVLTVHHIGIDRDDGIPGDRHDKMDVRDANLAALCQRCHFLADLDIHIANAAATRRRRRADAGQIEMELAI